MPLDATLGTGDSYLTLAEAQAIASDYGSAFSGTVEEQEQALRRAVLFIDSLKFGGQPKANQARAWPRDNAYGPDGKLIEGVPDGVKRAQVFAASQELLRPNSLAPTVTAPLKEVQVGEIRVEYSGSPSAASGASSLAKFGAISAALQGLVVTGGSVYR